MTRNRQSLNSAAYRSLVPAIVAAAWMLAAVPAGADPLTCSPSPQENPASDPNAFRCETSTRTYLTGFDVDNTFSFSFGTVLNVLTFAEVLRDFTMSMTAYFIDPSNPGTFLDRIPDAYHPETFFTDHGAAWVYFYVEDLQDQSCAPNCDEPTQGVEYAGAWFQDIIWFGDGGYNKPQMLHDLDGGPDTFDDVITVPGSFDDDPDPCDFTECGIELLKTPGDPVITGSANDFRSTTVVSTVPEPLTMWMFGLGVAGIAARMRRRRG